MRLIDADGSELQTQLKIIREAEYQIYGSGSWGFTAKCEHAIEDAPTVQPEITHEQAVEYLQSTGWMQEHDRQMMLDGVHRLTAQPEIIRCRECKFASGDSRICMKFDHSPIGELDFCSFAERREVTT